MTTLAWTERCRARRDTVDADPRAGTTLRILADWAGTGCCAGMVAGALYGGVVLMVSGAWFVAFLGILFGGVVGGLVGVIVGVLVGTVLAVLTRTGYLGPLAPSRTRRSRSVAAVTTAMPGLALLATVGGIGGRLFLVLVPVALATAVAAVAAGRIPPGRP